MAERRFTWGDDVVVRPERPGDVERRGSVCAITDVAGVGWVYLVEFGDGSDDEFPEARLYSA